ncbi:MAG: universal stress protein [Leptolyngbyaceae cyanobacterium]
MYRKILVALDHSAARSAVLDQAISLAKSLNASLMLVHVLSAYDADSPGLPVRTYHSYYPILDSVAWETYQKRWETYEQGCLNKLRQWASQAEAQGVTTEFTQTSGDPGRVICDVAGSWPADLILVGHRGRKGLSELFLGSVSNYVMHHAPCSVLVAHSTVLQTTPEAPESTAAAPA